MAATTPNLVGIDIDAIFTSAAFGNFLNLWARVEQFVFELLQREAGLKRPIFNAIFPDLRTHAAISVLDRVLDAKSKKLNPMTRAALNQLAVLNTARNALVHWGISSEDGKLFATNTARQYGTKRKPLAYPYNMLAIQAMLDDTAIISKILLIEIWPVRWRKSAENYSKVKAECIEALRSPWRYIPPQPTESLAMSRQNREEPRRQRKASRKCPGDFSLGRSVCQTIAKMYLSCIGVVKGFVRFRIRRPALS